MTHTTNFRRLLCCLLACLVLCCAVMRPITAHATGAEAALLPAVAGISPPVAIAGILVCLGIWWVASGGFADLCDTIAAAIPDDLFVTSATGAEVVPVITYNDTTYLSQELVAWVQDYVFTSADPVVFPLAFNGNDNYKAAVTYWLNATTSPNYETLVDFLWSCKWCACVLTTGNYRSYIWTNTPPTFNSETGEVTITNPSLTYIRFPSGSGVVNDWTGYTDTAVLSGVDTFQSTVNAVMVDAVTIDSPVSLSIGNTAPNLDDEEYAAWVARSKLYVIEGSGNNNDDEDKSIPYVPVTLQQTLQETGTQEQIEAQTGANSNVETVEVPDTTVTYVGDTNISYNVDLSGVTSQLQGIQSDTGQLVNSAAQVVTNLDSLLDLFTGTCPVASPFDAIDFGSMFDLFPFNIPYGIYQSISFWEASAAPPVITIPLPNYTGGGMKVYEFEVNFSEIPGMDELAAIVRAGELILFAIGLLMITRKVTKW